MPDLDTELTGLRTALSESTRQPDVRDVIDRAHRRTARRRTQVITVALVALVAAAVPLLRSTSDDKPPADSPPPLPITKTDNQPPFVDFFDNTHGIAEWMKCTSPQSCDFQGLLVTQDGSTWQSRALPKDIPLGGIVFAYMLGPRSIVLSAGGTPSKRWFSNDTGVTWQQVPDAPQGTIAAIPVGGSLNGGCKSRPANKCYDLTVTLPDSGRTSILASQPPFRVTGGQGYPDTNGTWWVQGVDNGKWVIASSRDDGRSWQVSNTGVDVSDHAMTDVLTAPNALYATLIDAPSNDPGYYVLTAILRSTDGGRTWERTWQPRPGSADEPQNIQHAPVIRDGKLTVLFDGLTYVSDDGKSFHKTDIPPREFRRNQSSGYVLTPPYGEIPDGAFPYELSNGVTGQIPHP